jgi:hypothetical protein
LRESREDENNYGKKKYALYRPIASSSVSHNKCREIINFIHIDDWTVRLQRKENVTLASLQELSKIFPFNYTESYEASYI